MLSENEKSEMIQDSKSIFRREAFKVSREKTLKENLSFDEYLKFLHDVQNTISPFDISIKKTITDKNKL